MEKFRKNAKSKANRVLYIVAFIPLLSKLQELNFVTWNKTWTHFASLRDQYSSRWEWRTPLSLVGSEWFGWTGFCSALQVEWDPHAWRVPIASQVASQLPECLLRIGFLFLWSMCPPPISMLSPQHSQIWHCKMNNNF